MDIKLELTIDEVNTILRTLGKHPFEEVVALVQKIKSQGDPQVDEIVKAEQAKAAAAELPAA
jgi:hypothetical protein